MKDKSKYRYLFKNIGLLALSNIATKFIAFFLVPLYTSILTTEEYGAYDFIFSTVGILVPVLTINIYEAVLRYSMDKACLPADVFSVGLRFCLLGNIVVVIILLINHILELSTLVAGFAIYFFLIFFTTSLSGIVTSMARGLGKIKELSIASVLASAVTIGLNVFLLCVLRLGIDGYFIANILGIAAQIVILLISIQGWKYVCLFSYNKQTFTEMVNYSLPTIANAIAWWINGLSDRYIVIFFHGVAVNGIYSVATKIPSILNLFQSIFSQAFMLSAVKEFDRDDNNGFFRNTFSSYNFVLVCVCSLIICCDKVLAKFLYINDFYEAWKYVPFLTISIIFGSLSGYMGSIFAAQKHSEYFAKCSGAGALANIILNVMLVPSFSALGASIATAISYWVVYGVSMFYLKRTMSIQILVVRDNVAYSLLMFQAFSLLLISSNAIYCYLVQIIFLLIELMLYKKEILSMLGKLKTMVRR